MTETNATTPLDATDAPDAPQLSPWRVGFAVLLLAVALGGATFWVKGQVAGATHTVTKTTWFAPYVDTTLTPTLQFQDPASNPARQAVLGFVVAATPHSCVPSWGGSYSLNQAESQLSLDNRISQYESIGGTIVVSFGGRDNTELATACTDTAALTSDYLTVIRRYHTSVIDFDLEGSALDNWASVRRRALAVARVERSVAASGGHLAVWLTLPTETDGLQANALSVVREFLRAKVAVAGVNIMAMDFNTTPPHMGLAAESALTSLEGQLAGLFPRYGITMSSRELWNHLGVTVMVGENDLAPQRFTVADARTLTSFASRQHLGRVSMWSLNRDAQCGAAYAEVGVLSNTCSGTTQSPLQFTHVFAGLTGTPGQSPAVAPQASSGVPDNPATSPYPIWQPGVPYPLNYLVVRDGNIYQAKWYNVAQDPAAQVQYDWQTPWLLIGPVLAGNVAPTTTTLAPSTYPAWSPTTHYTAGERVLLDGLPYQAKWYNTGDSPAAEATNPSGSPWSPLFTIPGEPSAATS